MQIKNSRTCIWTKKKYQPEQLLRFTIVNQEIVFDHSNGRGYYLYLDKISDINKIFKMINNRFKPQNQEKVWSYLNNKFNELLK